MQQPSMSRRADRLVSHATQRDAQNIAMGSSADTLAPHKEA
jgi:hypothetical protein